MLTEAELHSVASWKETLLRDNRRLVSLVAKNITYGLFSLDL